MTHACYHDNFPMAYSHHEIRQASWLLFLIGLGSLTQIKVGFSIGISEIFVYLAAPFLFIKNVATLKRDGMMTLLLLGMLVNIMNVVSGIANNIPV